MLSKEVIMVTGGAGFIGYHICKMYLEQNVKRLVIYDNLSSGVVLNVAELGEMFPKADIHLVVGDILDYDMLLATMKDFKVTLCNHHAAQLEITRCVEDPEYDINTNLIGTLNVLKAMVECGITRLINASSACVYGQNNSEFPSIEDIDYPKPHWVYGMSKHAAEQLISIYCHDYELRAVSFRYSIVMGVKEWFGRVGTMFIKRALDDEPLVIFGKGDQIRDIINVADVGFVNKQAIKYLDSLVDGTHEIFNVSSQIPTTVRQLAETVLEVVNGEIDKTKIVFEDPKPGEYSTIISDRIRIPNELHTMFLSNSKMVNKLVAPPTFSLKDTIAMEVDWIRSNRDYWSKYHI